jgi:hypothetical protein
MGKIEKPELKPYYDCGKCGITFDDFDEYETHCKEEPARHLTYGDAPCIYCKKIVHSPKANPIFPFSKETETTPAVCDACFDSVVKPGLIASGRMKAETPQQ